MKHLQQTLHTQSKHRGTYSFHPGNNIVLAEPDKIPAYHSSGLKKYVRKLPPLRNQRVINIPLLCSLLIRLVPQNDISCLPEGLFINKTTTVISEGMASIGKMKFRFQDVRDLLLSLRQEGVIICNLLDVRVIRDRYYKSLTESDE